MSDADVAEILKLPPEERLRLSELIWESLSATPEIMYAAVPVSVDNLQEAIEVA